MLVTSILLPAALALLGAAPAVSDPAVTITRTARGFQLVREGESYFIKGVGGRTHLDLLAAGGGNSLRTWDVGPDTGRLLDEAHELGLSVTLGIWLERAGGGFDYGSADDLARQTRKVRAAVEAHRDHPALLLWGLGNEMEGDGDDPRVYEHVEALARLVGELDPDHPTMTVIAELGEGGKKVRDLDRLAPSIDVIGINSYGSLESLPRRYRAAGGERPYIVTEHGPRGHWEAPRTAWGSPIEPSSTEKMDAYRSGYEAAVEDQPLCLGAYTFLWGEKQETTATWYGMLLPDGTQLGAVDVMTELWTGKRPRNRAPELRSLEVSREVVAPGKTVQATLSVRDPDRDELEVEWILRAASTRLGSFGEHEDRLEEFPDAIVAANNRRARVKLPAREGPYRLFAYVRDGRGRGAVANVPLLVER